MKNKKTLVTILTPGYNVGGKMNPYMNSILRQKYRPLEIIFVNDGSTDNTEKIFFSYRKKMVKSGIVVKYIYQKNKGVCGAINAGLKLVEGDFLTWPDSDDFLSDDSIQKKADFLLENKDIAVVTTDAYMFNEDNLEKPFGLLAKNYPKIMEENQFELFLDENSIFCPGCHMVRVDLLRDVNPDLEIFESQIGQNWQLLLPLYYKYKHGFINEPLFNYVVYSDSISHSNNSKIKDKIYKINEKQRILLNTLDRIIMPKEDSYRYKRFLKNKYFKEKIKVIKERLFHK